MARPKRKTYGVGVVGCGMIANFHTAALDGIRNAKVVAVADMVPASAERLGKARRCDWYTDVRKMVERDDLDLVTIATPSGAHMEPAVAAAKAGKHVICEKPLEITLPRVDAIVQACRRAGVKLATIFPERTTGPAQEMKQAIEAGRFGRITMGDCYNKWWRTQEYYDSGGWRGTWKLDGGGACMNQAVHAIDLLQWLMGPVDTVTAMADCLAHKRVEVEDVAVAMLRFKNGALGVIEAATCAYPGTKRRIEIHGDRGSARFENKSLALWEFADKTRRDAHIRRKYAPDPSAIKYGVGDPKSISGEGHKAVFRDMIRAIETDGAALCDGREGRKSVEIILAIYKSASTGKPVKLPMGR